MFTNHNGYSTMPLTYSVTSTAGASTNIQDYTIYHHTQAQRGHHDSDESYYEKLYRDSQDKIGYLNHELQRASDISIAQGMEINKLLEEIKTLHDMMEDY